MAMSGIRDMSILEEAPGDRLPVQTYVLEYDDVILSDAIKKSFTAEDRFSGFTTGWKALRRRSRMSGIWCLKQKSLTRTERWIVNRSPKYGRH